MNITKRKEKRVKKGVFHKNRFQTKNRKKFNSKN